MPPAAVKILSRDHTRRLLKIIVIKGARVTAQNATIDATPVQSPIRFYIIRIYSDLVI